MVLFLVIYYWLLWWPINLLPIWYLFSVSKIKIKMQKWCSVFPTRTINGYVVMDRRVDAAIVGWRGHLCPCGQSLYTTAPPGELTSYISKIMKTQSFPFLLNLFLCCVVPSSTFFHIDAKQYFKSPKSNHGPLMELMKLRSFAMNVPFLALFGSP